MSVAQTAHGQFEQAYQLVAAINGPLARNEAWDVARELLRDGVNQRHLAGQAQGLRPSDRAGTTSARAAGCRTPAE